LLYGFLVAASGCSRTAQTTDSFETKIKQNPETLISSLKSRGVFAGVQTSSLNRNYEVVSSTEDANYFVVNHQVVSSSRPPKRHELSLMYWRNRFSGCAYHETESDRESRQVGHEARVIQLACNERGMGVLYDTGLGRITRVFYYVRH